SHPARALRVRTASHAARPADRHAARAVLLTGCAAAGQGTAVLDALRAPGVPGVARARWRPSSRR
ncbi:hypothetical protein ACWGH4_34930, partial [Streptomyces sp. NPDC054847]